MNEWKRKKLRDMAVSLDTYGSDLRYEPMDIAELILELLDEVECATEGEGGECPLQEEESTTEGWSNEKVIRHKDEVISRMAATIRAYHSALVDMKDACRDLIENGEWSGGHSFLIVDADTVRAAERSRNAAQQTALEARNSRLCEATGLAERAREERYRMQGLTEEDAAEYWHRLEAEVPHVCREIRMQEIVEKARALYQEKKKDA